MGRGLAAAAALVLVFIVAGVAASPASAFIGESQVIAPGGSDLTGPAKTILEKPTFLPENVGEAAAYGGSEEAGAAAGVFEGASILPALGSVISFGVGTVVGSEICHVVGIEGCWYFGSEGADPAPEAGSYHWVWSGEADESHVFGWFWSRGFELYPGHHGYPDCENDSGLYPNGATSDVLAGSSVEVNCTLGGEKIGKASYVRIEPWRSGMANRVLEYHGSDDPGIENYEHEAPADWSERVAGELSGQESGPKARVGQKVASEIEGSGVADPYDKDREVPSCDGLKTSACVALVEELELVPNVVELDWEDAVIEELDTLAPEKTREEEAERVVELAPPPETTIETGTEVEIQTNPIEEDMPEFVPEPDEGQESEEYQEKKLGIYPWLPHNHEISGELINPNRGPGEVARTNPAEGTRLNPHTEHDVDVYTNPASAPVPGAGTAGSTCNASIGAVDFSPLNHGLGSKFPFGLFAFFVGWVGEWTASSSTPEFDFTILPEGAFGSSEGITWHIDLGKIAAVVEVCRVAFLFLSFVGLLWFLGTAAMKVQGDSS